MSILSLREINQSQLDTTPVIDGQLIVCLDTGNAYRDSKSAHVKIGSDLEVVGELPLAPLANKLYYLRPDKLYAYNGGDWVLLNDGLNNSAFSVTTSSSKSVDLNLLASNIVKTKVNIAGSGITSIVTNEDGGVVIDTPDPNSLLNTLTNEDIDLITGGYVADDGTTTPPKQVTIDSTLSVSGCAADAKAAGDGITKAQQVANDAAQQIKELKEEIRGFSSYTLPAATADTLGGVKVGENITNTDGKLSLTKENVVGALGYVPENNDTLKTVAWDNVTGKPEITNAIVVNKIFTAKSTTTKKQAYVGKCTRFSNGLQVIIGSLTFDSGAMTITFPLPFAYTNYYMDVAAYKLDRAWMKKTSSQVTIALSALGYPYDFDKDNSGYQDIPFMIIGDYIDKMSASEEIGPMTPDIPDTKS